MTFCSNEQKQNEIIKRVEYLDNYFTIKYLDNSEAKFFNKDKYFLLKLEEKMIKQAKEREILEYKKINFDKWFSFIMSIVSVNITSISLNKNLMTLACLEFIISFLLIRRWNNDDKKMCELRKYKILLENYKEFKDNVNISKVIEFDPIYREPVNILTIDKFSLNDVIIMKKKLKNKEK